MPPKPPSPDVFPRLREILLAVSPNFAIQYDSPKGFCLNLKDIVHKKRPVFFAWVQPQKNYVSFHLMPLYMNPAMEKKVPPELQKRRQGKACFNFTEVDEALFAKLEELVAAAEAGLPTWLKVSGIKT